MGGIWKRGRERTISFELGMDVRLDGQAGAWWGKRALEAGEAQRFRKSMLEQRY